MHEVLTVLLFLAVVGIISAALFLFFWGVCHWIQMGQEQKKFDERWNRDERWRELSEERRRVAHELRERMQARRKQRRKETTDEPTG